MAPSVGEDFLNNGVGALTKFKIILGVAGAAMMFADLANAMSISVGNTTLVPNNGCVSRGGTGPVIVNCTPALVIPPTHTPTPLIPLFGSQTTAPIVEGQNSQINISDVLSQVVGGTQAPTFQSFTANGGGATVLVAPGIAPVADAPYAQQSLSPWRMFMSGRYTHPAAARLAINSTACSELLIKSMPTK